MFQSSSDDMATLECSVVSFRWHSWSGLRHKHCYHSGAHWVTLLMAWFLTIPSGHPSTCLTKERSQAFIRKPQGGLRAGGFNKMSLAHLSSQCAGIAASVAISYVFWEDVGLLRIKQGFSLKGSWREIGEHGSPWKDKFLLSGRCTSLFGRATLAGFLMFPMELKLLFIFVSIHLPDDKF